MNPDDALSRARDAARACRWPEAFALLAAEDESTPLGPADLDLLANAAFFVGHAELSVAARTRAFGGFVDLGDRPNAGRAALSIAQSHFGRGAGTIGAGWFEHAEEYLGDDEDADAYAWLVWARATMAEESGSEASALIASADEVIAVARRLGNLDVETLGLLLKGQLLLRLGEPDPGGRLLDRVMATAVAGRLGPFATSWVYCGTISSCTSAGDYTRAWEWTGEVGRCSVGPASNAFPGDCRLHRAELLRLRGDWIEAETELVAVCDDLARWHVGHVGVVYAELGELSLRRGDLAAAETAFERATELGTSPEPGRTMLHLLRGETEAAAAGIRHALDAAHDDRCHRSRLLPAAVQVAVAGADLAWAATAVAELDLLSQVYSSPPQRARAAEAAGTYALAADDFGSAAATLRDAARLWDRANAPYDAARCRVILAAALHDGGDAAAHIAELTLALATFQRLGATRDARHVADLLGRPLLATRVDRALLFSDVERSTSLLAELGDDAWIELLRWHDSVLREAFERFQGIEVNQKGGGDGFFVAFTSAAAGLECSLEIQRRLAAASERRIVVRIGLHWASVLHDSGDFSGRGVHEAARIAGLARGGEILTSTATLDAAERAYPADEVRHVELRGLPGTMGVVSVPV